MKLDLTQQLVTKNGEPKVLTMKVKDVKADKETGEMHEVFTTKEVPATLANMLESAVLRQDGEKTEETISRRYKLYKKLNGKESVDLSDNEMNILATLSCEAYDIWHAGQIIEMLRK